MAIDSCRLLKATISGSASPEGPENLNSRLTLNRARVVKRYLAQKANVADSLLRIENEPNCWLRLREVVCNDSMIYNHSRMIAIIDTLADESLSYSLRQTAYKHLTLLGGGSTPTGIEAVKVSEEAEIANEPIYDLSGRRVEKPTQGFYIQGGKKFIVR